MKQPNQKTQPMLILGAELSVNARGELLATVDHQKFFPVHGVVEYLVSEDDETNIHFYQNSYNGLCDYYKMGGPTNEAADGDAGAQSTDTGSHPTIDIEELADDSECVEDVIDGKGCLGFLMVCMFAAVTIVIAILTALKPLK